MAHPLNQAVIDPRSRIVTEGYGILQPRIGIAVQSAARSRLASIYSGQSGFDIYTRAISDAYQDLFREGIFTGKGIYEISTLHAVLDRRFPRNALLSHDLIEGAYARAGQVTDVELIDDYPSHYSAYSRRKHRWVRGDWQIVQWMFGKVPDESGRLGPNPISYISRWKIFDNLRRSLLDPALFALFIAGWIGLPGGPLYWTIVPIFLLVLPSLVQLAFAFGRAFTSERKISMSEAFADFGRSLLVALLNLVFIPHQTLLAFDAIVRSLVRRFITGERLLEWETAAQAESKGSRRTPVDRYLALMPLVAIAVAVTVFFLSRDKHAIYFAAPILLLWALASAMTAWLNRPPQEQEPAPTPTDETYLLGHALRIWRYFHQFGEERHNYLIPDNVEEEGLFEAAALSRQQTSASCSTHVRQQSNLVSSPCRNSSPSHRRASTPLRVSKNSEAIFTTGTTPRPSNLSSPIPLFHRSIAETLWRRCSRCTPARAIFSNGLCCQMRSFPASAPTGTFCSRRAAYPASILLFLPHSMQLSPIGSHGSPKRRKRSPPPLPIPEGKIRGGSARPSIASVHCAASLPPTFPGSSRSMPNCVGCRRSLLREKPGGLTPQEAIAFALDLDARISRASINFGGSTSLLPVAQEFREALAVSIRNLRQLVADLESIARQSEELANNTEFAFLVDPGRQILSIGYEMSKQKTHEACYDMLASEARIATFLAIARGDLRQESWFKLARDYANAFGEYLLLSWTGTMFEYLMPALWMRSFPNTLISRTQVAVVGVQRAFARSLGIPWGISESGSARKDDAGHYHYHAYGIPQLALWFEADAGPVVAPYATFLALAVDSREALHNLRRMESSGWVGAYGFYESADFIGSPRKPTLAREWMAHHHGMSLLAIANLLCDNVVQRWFHSNPPNEGDGASAAREAYPRQRGQSRGADQPPAKQRASTCPRPASCWCRQSQVAAADWVVAGGRQPG